MLPKNLWSWSLKILFDAQGVSDSLNSLVNRVFLNVQRDLRQKQVWALGASVYEKIVQVDKPFLIQEL